MPIQDNYQSTVAVAEAQPQGAVSPLETSPKLADIQAWLKNTWQLPWK